MIVRARLSGRTAQQLPSPVCKRSANQEIVGSAVSRHVLSKEDECRDALQRLRPCGVIAYNTETRPNPTENGFAKLDVVAGD